MRMSLDIEAEPAVTRPADLTRIAPATFRGVDCAVLAERYAAYLRSRDRDGATEDPDVIQPVAAASSENV
jgi:hypothetical protein